VLRVAGVFKRNEPNISEEKLLFRALRDSNYPKIAQVDLPIFNGLLGDLFPSVEIPRKADESFEKIIQEECIATGLTPDPSFMLKVVQLGELLVIRHCVFIMGPPGAGKTTTYKTLARSNDKAGNKTTLQDLDPKTVSTKELYGYTNQTTKEWKNGLFSHYMQYFSEEMTDGAPKWIILDGDLDANWIESMNSVMDDNKLLTLATTAALSSRTICASFLGICALPHPPQFPEPVFYTFLMIAVHKEPPIQSPGFKSLPKKTPSARP
jgi:dynein heavy chain, axonemal